MGKNYESVKGDQINYLKKSDVILKFKLSNKYF